MLQRITPPPQIGADDILIVACLRNEALRLPWFLSYHRNLGVTRFLLIDNGSDDGTREMLLDQADITLFHTDQSYANSRCGIDWQNDVLAQYACEHWVLVLDVDEFFVFPGYEHTSLRAFVAYLDQVGAAAVLAPMLDKYPNGPIAETGYQPGADLLQACPYFDADGYELGGKDTPAEGLPIRGGPRHRLFWEGKGVDYPSPVLQKFPLIRWNAALRLAASTHVLPGGPVAMVSAALLHFKLLQDFAENARHETERGEHFADARQYRAYDNVMADTPTLSAMNARSVRFENSAQLCALGLMKTPGDYPF